MTSPPAHLLPLALEAMTSADACEVLGDALIESGWCDWRYIYVRTDTPVPREPMSLPADLGSSREILGYFLEDPRSSVYAPHQVRAIAAVLLFGEWSTARWPLVEAHEVRRLDALPAWYTGASLEDTIGDHQTTGEKVFAAAAKAGRVLRGGR